MSDDGYYSPYDEYDDMLWDSYAAPDLADDLAEYTTHSPVWQEDHVGEIENPYSDSEGYYNDDYYDDDPKITRSTLDGSPIQKTVKTPKRGRKRKADEMIDTGARDMLAKNIKGTVWATKVDKSVDTFLPGHQEKVALLTNWKELFGYQKVTNRESDETWARDLGLADMGLTNQQGRAIDQDEHEDGNYEKRPRNASVEGEEEEEDENDDDSIGISEQAPYGSSTRQDTRSTLPETVLNGVDGEEEAPTTTPRKKRKLSEPSSAEPIARKKKTTPPPKGGRRGTIQTGDDESETNQTKTRTGSVPKATQEIAGKKRKMSSEQDSGHLPPRQSKRVASTRIRETAVDVKPRTTRSKTSNR